MNKETNNFSVITETECLLYVPVVLRTLRKAQVTINNDKKTIDQIAVVLKNLSKKNKYPNTDQGRRDLQAEALSEMLILLNQ